MKRASLRPFEIAGLAVFTAVSCALLLSVWFAARDRRNRAVCGYNLKQIQLATWQYVRDYDEYFPPADKWQTVLWPYSKSTAVLNCPSARNGGYAVNKYLSLMNITLLETPGSYETMPLYFETHLTGRDRCGGPEAWLNPARHSNGVGVVFAASGWKVLRSAPSAKFWSSPEILNPPLQYLVWGIELQSEVRNRP